MQINNRYFIHKNQVKKRDNSPSFKQFNCNFFNKTTGKFDRETVGGYLYFDLLRLESALPVEQQRDFKEVAKEASELTEKICSGFDNLVNLIKKHIAPLNQKDGYLDMKIINGKYLHSMTIMTGGKRLMADLMDETLIESDKLLSILEENICQNSKLGIKEAEEYRQSYIKLLGLEPDAS